MSMRKELLKEILAVPTSSLHEEKMVKFLVDYAMANYWAVRVDSIGNVYITKGTPDYVDGAPGFYPLVCAHTDAVHGLKPTVIHEENDRMFAVDPETGNAVGCGGDDKAGIFICLELLESQSCLKAAFFIGEEIYCVGSNKADATFFEDVGYIMEFDSPEHDIISFSSDGAQLFDEHGEFAKLIVPIMETHAVTKWQRHPYTDVAILKRRFPVSCINLPAGYYRMHSKHEYVQLRAVQNSIDMGTKMLAALGQRQYPYDVVEGFAKIDHHLTGLVCAR